MKEKKTMTEQEKIKEAKRLYKTANAEQKYLLESLFPELFVSEDERIKTEIVRFINLHKNDTKKSDEWCAWLEKQATKPKWGEEDEEMMNHCIGAIHIAGCRVTNRYTANDKKAMTAWVMSLKKRMEEQQ